MPGLNRIVVPKRLRSPVLTDIQCGDARISTKLFTLACIRPAPLNSVQLPSCEVDVGIIRRGGGV